MEIYLAGLSAREQTLLEFEKEGIVAPFVLETYMNFRGKKKESFLLDYVKRNNGKFLLDSGGFTFINTLTNATKKEIYDYLDEYIDFINDKDIKLFFELDVDAIIGYEEVKKITKILENKTGKRCIPVFHYQTRTKEDFVQMCKDYDYVSIGSDSRRDKKIYRYYKWAIQTAHKYGCKIHGLGFTPLTNLNNNEYKFDSVDSTSWLSGGRFAHIYEFDGRRLVSANTKSQYKAKHRLKGTENKDFNYKTLDKQNLYQWLKFIEYKSHHKNFF